MLYFNYVISKNLQEIGCKSESGRFWQILDKSNEKSCYELKNSGDIPAFSIDDIILNEENAKNIWRVEKIWRLKIQQIFDIAISVKNKEEAINNFMANEYGYESEAQMSFPEASQKIIEEKLCSKNGYTQEDFLIAFKRAMGSFATTVSQKTKQSESTNTFEVKFLLNPNKKD